MQAVVAGVADDDGSVPPAVGADGAGGDAYEPDRERLRAKTRQIVIPQDTPELARVGIN